MNTFLKRVLFLLSFVALGLFLYSFFVENIFAPRLSPKDTVEFKLNDLKLEVFYNRPFKKDREILEPWSHLIKYGEPELTKRQPLKPNQTLDVNGMPLPKGKYTLWTVPKDSVWTVIFNSKQYPWGVTNEMIPYWDPNYDVLNVDIPVEKLNTTVEQFTIAFDNSTDNLFLTMAWDDTKVAVPLK